MVPDKRIEKSEAFHGHRKKWAGREMLVGIPVLPVIRHAAVHGSPFPQCEKGVLTPLFRDVIRILKEFLFMCGYMSVYTCTRAHTCACKG